MLLGANDARGVGEYFASCDGVGQLAKETLLTPATIQLPQQRVELDLREADSVRQLKAAMALSPFMMPFIFGDNADPDFDERFFEDPIWGRLSTKFSRLWIEAFREANPGIPDPESMFVSPHLYPRASGIFMVLVTLGYRVPGAVPTADFTELDRLTTFFDQTGADPQRGRVLEPFFSRREQEPGAVPVQASTIAYAGLGLLGLVTLGVVFGGRQKRRR